MSRRLRQLLAWWFVLQITLPFTAPLQTLDIYDLFGVTHHATTSPSESATTPTMSESSGAISVVSILASATVRSAAAQSIVASPVRSPLTSQRLLPAPHVQRSVLRL